MRWDVRNMIRSASLASSLAIALALAGCGGAGVASTSTPVSAAILAITGTPATTIAANSNYSFTPAVTGAGDGALSFSISNRPVWATFNQSSGQLSGQPGNADTGAHNNIGISVSNGKASATLPAFSIQVTAATQTGNAPPTISGTPSTTVAAGSAYTFTPTANDTDRDILTYAITNKPSWMSFSTSTGQLSGTPSVANAGNYANIQISVSDGKAGTALPAFSIAVTQTGNGSVALSWTPPTQNTDGSSLSGLLGYHIHYGSTASALNQVVDVSDPSATTFNVQGLSSGTYFFTLSAYTAGAESTQTGTVSATVM